MKGPQLAGFPPRARLEAVLAALALRLPETHGVLIAAEELAPGRAALEGLADPATRTRDSAALSEVEADWIADRLLAGWARIGEPAFAPTACLVAPADAWFPGPEAEIPLQVVAVGLAPGWEAHWPEGVEPEPAEPAAPGRRAALRVQAPQGKDAAGRKLVVRAIGRLSADEDGDEPGRREILLAEAEIAFRRPVLIRRPDGHTVIARDQTGRPAAGLQLRLAGREVVVPETGAIALDMPLTAGAQAEVGGVAVPIHEAIREAGDDPG